jgi:HK97 family phage major capsid protein
MYRKDFIKRSYTGFAGNAFITSQSAAVAVNPQLWDTQLRDYQEANLIYTKVGVTQYDFRKPGRSWTVTIDGTPTTAADLVETNAVSVQAISNRQVTFNPVERGVAFEVSKNELEDAFFPVMENITKKIAYALALRKDTVGVTAAQDGATTKLVADNVVASNIASSNTIKLSDFTRAVRAIKNLNYVPTEAFINPSQEEQILNITQVQKANEFGTRSAIESGLIGQLFGVKIYVTQSIATAANRAKMILQGTTRSGEKAVGYAVKRDPTVEMEELKTFRQYRLIGTERYDFKVLHPDAIVTVESYAA